MSENTRATLNALEDIFPLVMIKKKDNIWMADCYQDGQLFETLEVGE